MCEGETILWLGQPDFDSQYRSEKRQTKTVGIGFAVIFAVMALSAWATQDHIAWKFSLMFLVVSAAGMVVFTVSNSRFKGYGWQYAVTSKRVLFYNPHGEGNSVLRDLALEQIKKVHLRATSIGDARIIFEAEFLTNNNQLTFYHVLNAAEVQGLVVSLLPGAK